MASVNVKKAETITITVNGEESNVIERALARLSNDPSFLISSDEMQMAKTILASIVDERDKVLNNG